MTSNENHDQPTTPPPDFSLPRAEHRRMTSWESRNVDVLTALLDVSERMAVIAAIGSRQASESLEIRRCFSKILTFGHAPSADLARVGLAHVARSIELDNQRAEHVGVVQSLVASAQQVLRQINASIEQALVGRSRQVGATCSRP